MDIRVLNKITNYYYIIQYCYFPSRIGMEHQVGWIFDRKVSHAFFLVYRIHSFCMHYSSYQMANSVCFVYIGGIVKHHCFNFFLIIHKHQINSLSIGESSWSWSYGSWNYNSLCNQYLSPLTLWVWILNPTQAIQHYVIKFVSDLRQICGFLRLLVPRFPPPIKLTATI